MPVNKTRIRNDECEWRRNGSGRRSREKKKIIENEQKTDRKKHRN